MNHQHPTIQSDVITGFKACLPTVLGYLGIGFAAGVIQKAAGLSIAEIGLLSALVYAGSAQFIIAAMILAGNPISSIVLTVFFINLRHLLLSAALAPYFKKISLIKNFFTGSLVTDETFGVAIAEGIQKKTISYDWMFGLNITAYLNWILANIIGGILGDMITDFRKYGIDFALPAMFAGLLIFQFLTEKSKIILYIIVACFTILIFIFLSIVLPGIWGVMLTAMIGSFFGLFLEKIWK